MAETESKTEYKELKATDSAKHTMFEELGANVKKDVKNVEDQVKKTFGFLQGVRHGQLDTSSIDKVAPEWIIEHAEKSCLSGMCIEIACCDWYSPNTSGCCCCKPWYVEEEYDFQDFWTQILPQLHTGDIVLACWPAEDGNQASKFLTHSVWSHVGFIYRPSDCLNILKHRCEDYPNAHLSRPLVAQMLMGGDPAHPSAFYMNDFEQAYKDYLDLFSNCPTEPEKKSPFMVSVRFLTGVDRNEEFYKAIEATVNENQNKTYEMDPMSGVDLCSFWPCCQALNAAYDEKTVFCSEFVAMAYQKAGLLNPKLNPAEYIPSMFDTSRYLWLKKGHLSKQHTLIGPRTLEERKRMGYKGQPGYLCPRGNGEGIYGTDVSKQIKSLHYGEAPVKEKPKSSAIHSKPGQHQMGVLSPV